MRKKIIHLFYFVLLMAFLGINQGIFLSTIGAKFLSPISNLSRDQRIVDFGKEWIIRYNFKQNDIPVPLFLADDKSVDAKIKQDLYDLLIRDKVFNLKSPVELIYAEKANLNTILNSGIEVISIGAEQSLATKNKTEVYVPVLFRSVADYRLPVKGVISGEEGYLLDQLAASSLAIFIQSLNYLKEDVVSEQTAPLLADNNNLKLNYIFPGPIKQIWDYLVQGKREVAYDVEESGGQSGYMSQGDVISSKTFVPFIGKKGNEAATIYEHEAGFDAEKDASIRKDYNPKEDGFNGRKFFFVLDALTNPGTELEQRIKIGVNAYPVFLSPGHYLALPEESRAQVCLKKDVASWVAVLNMRLWENVVLGFNSWLGGASQNRLHAQLYFNPQLKIFDRMSKWKQENVLKPFAQYKEVEILKVPLYDEKGFPDKDGEQNYYYFESADQQKVTNIIYAMIDAFDKVDTAYDVGMTMKNTANGYIYQVVVFNRIKVSEGLKYVEVKASNGKLYPGLRPGFPELMDLMVCGKKELFDDVDIAFFSDMQHKVLLKGSDERVKKAENYMIADLYLQDTESAFNKNLEIKQAA